MTTEIGTKNKTIKYINIHKEGLTAEDAIDVDNRWATPILDKQSDYLVAISRFEVPLNRVPVTAQMDNCIEIFRYNDDLDEIKEEQEQSERPQKNKIKVEIVSAQPEMAEKLTEIVNWAYRVCSCSSPTPSCSSSAAAPLLLHSSSTLLFLSLFLSVAGQYWVGR